MIFYFSGTGNSEGVARIIADRTCDQAVSIVDKDPSSYSFGEGDRVGFVFPVYAYAAPEMMVEFARRVEVGEAYSFAVCTFSNVTGDALEHLGSFVRIDSGFGVKMPDNYPVLNKILETEESAIQKLKAAEHRINEIIPKIQAREAGVFDTLRGDDPHEKSSKGYPWFNENGRSTKPYWVDEGLCVGCGLCERMCPAHAIELIDGKPIWAKEICSMCMACLNRCPREAIQYGEYSSGRFRYHFVGFDTSAYFRSK